MTTTTVDIAGNFPDLATRKRSLHTPFDLGATNFPLAMVQGPVSLQVRRPGDTLFTISFSVVLERRSTEEFNTVNPGRATYFEEAVVTFPDGATVEILTV